MHNSLFFFSFFPNVVYLRTTTSSRSKSRGFRTGITAVGGTKAGVGCTAALGSAIVASKSHMKHVNGPQNDFKRNL